MDSESSNVDKNYYSTTPGKRVVGPERSYERSESDKLLNLFQRVQNASVKSEALQSCFLTYKYNNNNINISCY